MSMFEDNRYRWRETCFVLFNAKKRPALASVKRVIAALNKRVKEGFDPKGVLNPGRMWAGV